MSARLFHLVPRAAWEAHLAGGSATWAPPSFASEGFVHLSFAEQLAGTLDVHFARHDAVWLLEVDRERVAPELRLEASRDAALFPHLYRALDEGDVIASWLVERTPGGWQLPAFTSSS